MLANAKSKQVDEYLQSHHVDNFDFVDYGPGGKAIRTTFFKTNGGQFSQSSTFVDASSAGGGQGEGHVVQQEGSGTEHGHAQTIVTGQGAASASSSGPGGTITVISMPGGAYTPVPMQLGVPSSGPPGSIIKEDLSCPVCLGQNAPTKE
ncbi:uncharacterized protein LOC121376943 [Gigantopelta aegis]|uniref:uncharacterized protein LOC121376943 n=1 Tax=Gigantopelta aegis TaxID=1735272 RepID=UPI001B88B270|nr:uncharacterized protein LOC121376943 [Gigantopelta aegis]